MYFAVLRWLYCHACNLCSFYIVSGISCSTNHASERSILRATAMSVQKLLAKRNTTVFLQTFLYISIMLIK